MSMLIRVPATSANIGPGFDTLGVALALYNSFRIERSESSRVAGCDDRFSGRDNLFLVSFREASERLGRQAPEISLVIDAQIPLARGLGSSASLIVGGAAAAVLAAREGRARDYAGFDGAELQFILDAAAAIEGHPDNVAPAVYGGFRAAIAAGTGQAGGAHTVSAGGAVDETWRFHALIPPFELSTRLARAALPEVVSRGDAVFNVGRAAMVALAFAARDRALLGAACEDRLHQPYRKSLIPGYEEIIAACGNAGASACWLSGAGPTIMALTSAEEAGAFGTALHEVLTSRREGAWTHQSMEPDASGVRILG